MTYPDVLRDIVIYHAKKGIKATVIFEYLAEMVNLRTIQNWISIFKKEQRSKPMVSTGRPRTQTTFFKKKRIKRLLKAGNSIRSASNTMPRLHFFSKQ